jgi:hypothetical protein
VPLTTCRAASSNSRCRSVCNTWLSSRTASRWARPLRFVGGTIGAPISTCTLRGKMNFAPFGIARSLPAMPTGTIGTPAFTAM